MERRTGILRNTKHADSSPALNMLQHLQSISSGHGGSGGSIASSTHVMSAPNPMIPIYNSGGSVANSSTVANNNVVNDNMGSWKRRSSLRVQDRYMPTANVVRIMRRALPGHAKISDEAKQTVQECVSEYISFITGEANDKCQREQRKTITAEDVLSAMRKLGFDNYIPCLSLYLNRYRENEHVRTTQRTEPTETYVYAPPLPLVANDNSHSFDYGPVPNPQGMDMNMMTLPRALPGPSAPNYGPGLDFQFDPNNSGMFDAMGLSGYYGNTLADGPAGGSSSQNAVPNFDPFTQLFK